MVGRKREGGERECTYLKNVTKAARGRKNAVLVHNCHMRISSNAEVLADRPNIGSGREEMGGGKEREKGEAG